MSHVWGQWPGVSNDFVGVGVVKLSAQESVWMLARECAERGERWPFAHHAAKRLCLCASSIRRALNEMADMGQIAIARHGNRRVIIFADGLKTGTPRFVGAAGARRATREGTSVSAES